MKPELERALSFFINPENQSMEYEQFAKSLFAMGIGKNIKDMTNGEKALNQTLEELYGQITTARKFNETYIGHLLSEASLPGMLAYMLALRFGSNTVAREVSIRETELEPEALRYLIDIIGYDPNTASGTFTSGGSLAVMTALAVARKKKQKEFEELGKPLNQTVVFATNYAHYSLDKAVDLLGGTTRSIKLTRIPTKNFKMDPESLKATISRTNTIDNPIMAIFAIAGETETGLIDPLSDIAKIAKDHGIFLIADGAYGTPYKLSKVRDRFDGLEQFDAVIVDGHKALYTPYSNGAVLFKNAEDHALLNEKFRASYVGFEENKELLVNNLLNGKGSLGEKRIEGSASAGSILSTVAVFRALKVSGLKAIYDNTLDMTSFLLKKVEESPYLAKLHDPELNILCFGLHDDILERLGLHWKAGDKKILEKNAVHKILAFIDAVRKTLDNDYVGNGGYFFSSTKLPFDQGYEIPCFRSCIMHPRTTTDHIEQAISALEITIESHLKKLKGQVP